MVCVEEGVGDCVLGFGEGRGVVPSLMIYFRNRCAGFGVGYCKGREV